MLAIIGTVGVPACYGGFETLVENLLDKNDPEVLVYCSSKQYSAKLETHKNAQLRYIDLNANGVQSIPYDVLSMMDAVRRGADTILVLGVSGAIIIPFLRWFTKVKIVTNIDGLEWRRDKWGKLAKGYLKWAESLAVRFSHEVVADNQAIADYVCAEYKKSSHVIAYGGDHAVVDALSEKTPEHPFALGLCRIEPENNVHLILEAFVQSQLALKFVGNWNSSPYGQQLKAKYSQYPNITILDPIYDLAKLSLLRGACVLYVHGHSAGGTNPSLVEMMHFGKPIVCFDCNYNRATTEGAALYFKDVGELVELIDEFDPQGNSTHQVASQMIEIANRRYTWSIVKEQYFDLCR
ncbi:DUF1972 domain-containing protein [Halomonas denitrificans]|nr:DUF1972 domain-containing protein [Halomonas denitrificans]